MGDAFFGDPPGSFFFLRFAGIVNLDINERRLDPAEQDGDLLPVEEDGNLIPALRLESIALNRPVAFIDLDLLTD